MGGAAPALLSMAISILAIEMGCGFNDCSEISSTLPIFTPAASASVRALALASSTALTRAWITLLLLSAAATGVSVLMGGGYATSAGAAILVLAWAKARLILVRNCRR